MLRHTKHTLNLVWNCPPPPFDLSRRSATELGCIIKLENRCCLVDNSLFLRTIHDAVGTQLTFSEDHPCCFWLLLSVFKETSFLSTTQVHVYEMGEVCRLHQESSLKFPYITVMQLRCVVFVLDAGTWECYNNCSTSDMLLDVHIVETWKDLKILPWWHLRAHWQHKSHHLNAKRTTQQPWCPRAN